MVTALEAELTCDILHLSASISAQLSDHARLDKTEQKKVAADWSGICKANPTVVRYRRSEGLALDRPFKYGFGQEEVLFFLNSENRCSSLKFNAAAQKISTIRAAYVK